MAIFPAAVCSLRSMNWCVVIELLVWLLIWCVLIELLCRYWTNKKENQSRSQHSTWECNIWLDKDQHSTLQVNFVVLNAIVKTLEFNLISESSTLNFVHQHSSLLINIALDTCAFRERWTLNHQVNCWVTKGVPIPPKIKVDHDIQLCSSTSY